MTITSALDLWNLDEGRPTVVGVCHHGEQVLRSSDAAVEARLRIASLTKTFTAVALVRAAADRGIALDRPVLELLPQLDEAWAADPAITVAHLLAQTSGLASTLSGADIAALGDGNDALTEAARLTAQQGSARVPGQRWEYYNGNYFLAGALIAKLTGQPYEQALSDLVLTPYQLSDTGFTADDALVLGTRDTVTLPEAGYPRGRRPSGGLISTAGDVLTFTQHLMTDTTLLTAVAQQHTAADDPMRYGLGWALGPSGQMYLNGRLPGYRAVLLALPDRHTAFVALSADEDALPTLAGWANDFQQPLTGDDLTTAIVDFAA